MQLAVQYFQNGNLGGAEQITNQILAKQPRNSDALHLLGVINAISGKPSTAATLFKKALARDERNIELHANLAKALCELGNYQEALLSYERAIKLGGAGANVASIVMEQGTALKQLGRHAEALSCYDKALSLRPDSAETWTNKGTLLDELQRHEEAISCYDKAISINPRLAMAWFSKGTVLDTLKKYDAALACYDQAIALFPDNPRFWSNRGVTLDKAGRYEEALASYAKALSIKPDYAEALNNRGLVLNELKHHDDAVASYDQALGIKPDYAEAWSNRGLALSGLKRYEDALTSHDRALSIRPDYAEAWTHRGLALYELTCYDDALTSCDRALNIKPDHAAAWTNRGLVLCELKRHDDAVASHDTALAIEPEYAAAWSNRGLALNELGRYDDALASYDRALDIKPDYAQAWTNRGVVLHDLNRHQEALDNFERALAIVPDHAGAHYNAGICRLAIGDFERGWQGYEWRWEYSMKEKNPFPDIRKWEGEKNIPSLLIWAEQGIGDQILYSSMLEEMKQYSGNLMVSLDARLVPLYQRSFSDIQFVAHDESLYNEAVEMQIPIGSIGGFLRKNISDFSRQKASYLAADSERTGDLRRRIRKDTRLVGGLSWTSTNEKIGSSKSMGLQDLLPLLSCDRFSFVDLQYGDTALERRNMKTSSGIDIEHIDDIDNFNDIDGLASLIDACDFVVTVSNVTAHLAGALGKKTYLLVPYAHGKLWYWHVGRENSPWYPSVSVFSQAVDGDWKSVVADVMEEMNSML